MASTTIATQTRVNLLRRWWIPFTVSSLCVVAGHLTIKSGLNAAAHASSGAPATHLALLRLAAQPEVIVGLVVYLLGTACWILAVSQKEISFLYPLSSVNYVLVVAASWLLLGEPPSLRRVEGMALIVLGMVALNRTGGKAPR